MRKRIAALVLALILLLGLTGCGAGSGKAADSGKLQVVCSLFPYYDFVREIGGQWVEPVLLVTAGKEAHSFEPTPLDVVRLSKADVFVYNGGEGEQWVDQLLSAAGEHIGTVVRMMDYADTVQEEYAEGMQTGKGHDHDAHDHDAHDHDAHDHEGAGEEHDSDEIEYDEHIWTSPVEAMKLCRAIAEALCAQDPEHAEQYRQNLEDYLARLCQLDGAFRQVVAERKRDILIFGDRFPLLYFCREYGLSYRAAFHGCSGDTEPSLYTLKYLIDRVGEEQIPVVYTLELSSQKVARAIAETTGAEVVTFYSLQTVSRTDFENGEGYLSLMQHNVQALREGIC